MRDSLINISFVFSYLFANSQIIDIDSQALPATTLTDNCYFGMFEGCTSLVNAPELPATTLADSCYNHMFSSCTSLTTAPVLPATTLADSCYGYMFSGCTSLTRAPELPATTLTNDCYHGMFYSCTGLTTAPELPATTLTNDCYHGMFDECTSLVNAPELPAITLAKYCYFGMFEGCINLNYIKMLATDISASGCLYDWVAGVSSTGTFVKNPDATWDVVGVSGVPSGWTVKFDGEEEENDYGIEFPLYLEFDYCENFGFMKTCYRNADELGLKLYNLIVDVIDKYGEAVGVWKTVSEEVLNSLGIEIYVEGNKVKTFDLEQSLYYMNEPDADYPTTIVESNGELVKEYM